MVTNDQFFLEGTNGKAVMLIHGITSGAAYMIPMAEYLNKAGYNVWCVNLAGHATYPEDLVKTTKEDFLRKGEADYAFLKNHFDEIFVAGISTGGCLSLELASLHPEIAGVISISSPLALCEGTFITDCYPDDQVYFHRPMEGKEGLFAKYHIHYEDIAINIFKELIAYVKHIKTDNVLEKIKCPTIVMQAKNDAVADPSSAEEIYSRIQSAVKVLYTPEEGDHGIVLTEGRHEVFRRTVEFLNNL